MSEKFQRLFFDFSFLIFDSLLLDLFEPVTSGLCKFSNFFLKFITFLSLGCEILSDLFYLTKQIFPSDSILSWLFLLVKFSSESVVKFFKFYLVLLLELNILLIEFWVEDFIFDKGFSFGKVSNVVHVLESLRFSC
jgi:hypothetical protein